MKQTNAQSGFSLIELMVAAIIFSFIVTSVTSLFIQALDIQRRASGIQKIQENVQFVFESIGREVRVSVINTKPDSNCSPPAASTQTLSITHPVNGDITYHFNSGSGVGFVTRDAGDGAGPQTITSSDVNIKAFAFCVRGAGQDGRPARVTMAATVESLLGRPSTRVSASAQTTIVSRDLASDLAP